MWMDHRAQQETDVINGLNHPAFQYVGGKVSIEMQLPKLLWLKRNLQENWYKSKKFMDLPDFLTWKATHDDSRLFLLNIGNLRPVFKFRNFADHSAAWFVNGITLSMKLVSKDGLVIYLNFLVLRICWIIMQA